MGVEKEKAVNIMETTTQNVDEHEEEGGIVHLSSSQLMYESFSVQNYREMLAKILIIKELPIESRGFKNFVGTLTCSQNINFAVPSRFTWLGIF